MVVNGTLNFQRYCDEIVVPVVVPFFANVMQESYSKTVPVRTQHVTHKPPFNKTILSLWIGLHDRQIEHVWDILGRRLRQRHNVNNVAELVLGLQHEWNEISMQEVQNLIMSMRRRCMAVIAANGGHKNTEIEGDLKTFTLIKFYAVFLRN